MPIGRYTRLDEIGRGSFATVYQGVHTVSLVFFFCSLSSASYYRELLC